MKTPLLKRPFDILVSGLGLIFSAWLWAIIWIFITLEDGWPIFIRQKRIGKGGRLFTSFKFRSMIKSALNEAINIQATENDYRITGVGKFLRKTALDELPQLLNIFIGDMSFVGPRALLPSEIEVNGDRKCLHIHNIPGYKKRILIRPGLTGIAQIYVPRNIPRRHKFKYDLLYIKKMNFLLDVKLILLSFLITFKAKWEIANPKLKILEKKLQFRQNKKE